MLLRCEVSTEGKMNTRFLELNPHIKCTALARKYINLYRYEEIVDQIRKHIPGDRETIVTVDWYSICVTGWELPDVIISLSTKPKQVPSVTLIHD